MFRITIEIVPFGNEAWKRTLYKIDGANVDTDMFDNANYKVASVSGKGTEYLNIEAFNRKEGILKLTEKIIKKLIKTEKD